MYKAAILKKLNEPLDIEQINPRNLTYGQVCVKVLVSGLCGAQLQEIRGEKNNAKFLPHLLGHEGCGIVLDIGPGVTKVKPGDKVMLNSPVYENIWRWILEVNATTVDTPLTEEDLTYKLDLAAIEKEYQSGVKVHILCHPHNPVGVIFDKQQLTALAELANRYQVVILSDEIHAPLSYDAKTFTPFLAVSDVAKEVGIIITSASKSFNLAGLKCAFIITQSSALQERINKMPLAVTRQQIS